MLSDMFHFVYVREIILIILGALIVNQNYQGPKRLHKDCYLITS